LHLTGFKNQYPIVLPHGSLQIKIRVTIGNNQDMMGKSGQSRRAAHFHTKTGLATRGGSASCNHQWKIMRTEKSNCRYQYSIFFQDKAVDGFIKCLVPND